MESDEEFNASNDEGEREVKNAQGEVESADEDEVPQKDIPGRKAQHYVYRPNVAFYPYNWNGRYLFKDNKYHDVYGLIIFVRDGVCYFLTQMGLFPYKPKFLDSENDQLVGCWAKFNVKESDRQICSVPKFAQSPLHTRIFKNDNQTWTLLIYDYVCVERDNIVSSWFLGTIQNEDIELIDQKTNALWEFCNVEYEITAGFKNKRLSYSANVVKFHGSVEVHMGLPRILSYRRGEDDNCSFAKDLFQQAFQTKEEIERERKEEIREKRERLVRKTKMFLPFASNDEEKSDKDQSQQDLVKHEENNNAALNSIQSMIDSGESISVRSRKDNLFGSPSSSKNNVSRNDASSSSFIQNNASKAQQQTTSPKISMQNSNSMPKASSNVTQARGKVVNFQQQQPTTSNFQHSNVQAPAKRKTALFTYAASGFSLELAKLYLRQNYNVVFHFVDPHTEKPVRELLSDKPSNVRLIHGPLNKNFVDKSMDSVFKWFGKIDVVFHFASALRKVDGRNEPYNELRYLFKENVRPLMYIADALKRHMPIEDIEDLKLITVAPIFNIAAVQRQLIPNLKTSLAYLKLAADEIGQNDVNGQYISTKFVGYEEFQDLDFSRPNIVNQVCKKLEAIHEKM